MLTFTALQTHLPFTVTVFERSLKPIRDKLPSKRLPTDRRAKPAVFPNGSVDVGSIVRELSLTNDRRTLDGDGDISWLAFLNCRCC
jgi:hypothetical protein